MGEVIASARQLQNKERPRRKRAAAAAAAALALAAAAGTASCTAASTAPSKPINVKSITQHDIPNSLPPLVQNHEQSAVSIITTRCVQKITLKQLGVICDRASDNINSYYSGVNIGNGILVTVGHALAPNEQSGEPAIRDDNCGDNFVATLGRSFVQVNTGKVAYNFEREDPADFPNAPQDIGLIELNANLLKVAHSHIGREGASVAPASPKPGEVDYAVTWQDLGDSSVHNPFSPHSQPTIFATIFLGQNSNGVGFFAAGYRTYSLGAAAKTSGANGDSGAGIFNNRGQLVAAIDGENSPITAAQLKASTGTVATGLPTAGHTERATMITDSLLDSLKGAADMSQQCKLS